MAGKSEEGGASVQCRLIHEIGTRAYLRIYWGDSSKRECSVGGYHNAVKPIGDSPKVGDWDFMDTPDDYQDPQMWPTHCRDCGAPVPTGYFLNQRSHYLIRTPDGVERPGTVDDGERVLDSQGHAQTVCVPQYQVFHKRLYNTASGSPEPGDMYWAPWYHGNGLCLYWDNCTDPRGHLIVVLPNGREWDVDSRAGNCDMQSDRTHRCWVRHGEPPNVHVDKGGHTCHAGAGSILVGNYHGFLHHGQLTEC